MDSRLILYHIQRSHSLIPTSLFERHKYPQSTRRNPSFFSVSSFSSFRDQLSFLYIGLLGPWTQGSSFIFLSPSESVHILTLASDRISLGCSRSRLSTSFYAYIYLHLTITKSFFFFIFISRLNLLLSPRFWASDASSAFDGRKKVGIARRVGLIEPTVVTRTPEVTRAAAKKRGDDRESENGQHHMRSLYN